MMPIFILPLYVDLPISIKARSKKNLKRLADGKPFNRYWMNLNVYRNLGRMLEHKIKEAFYPVGIPEGFKAEKIRITYHIQRKGKVKFDIGNVFAIVDKYFLDWMVTAGYIPDDNLDHVDYGQITGENGCDENRVIAHIEILEEMK
jgi:hypothetical protein